MMTSDDHKKVDALEIDIPSTKNRPLGAYKPLGTVRATFDGIPYTFKVPIAVARTLKKLQDGGEVQVSTISSLRQLIAETSEDAAWKRIVSLIDMRDYSSLEASEKLRLDGYPDDVGRRAIERAQSCHLIDDERFGEFYVRGKISAGWGKERIQRELKRKGIDVESVPGWPDEYFNDDDDYRRAFAIASRKHLNGKNDFNKIMRLLASKGYSPAIAYRVAHGILEDE